MRPTFAAFVHARLLLPGVLVGCAFVPGVASAIDLYTSSDANDVVQRYNGGSGVWQSVLTPSYAAGQQLGIHFGSQAQNRVLIGHFNGGVEEFNATTGAWIKTYNPGGGVQWAGVFGPNGNVIIGDWNSNTVDEYNAANGQWVQLITNITNPSDMKIGPNGNLFICSYAGGFVKEVNASNGAFVSQWWLPTGAVANDIAFHPNGEILVTAMIHNCVYRFDGVTHNLLGSFTHSNWGNPHGIAFSPWTGNVLVIDGVTAQVHEFDPTTYVEITPTFLSPTPAEKIVDLDFFLAPPVIATPVCPSVGTLAVCPCGNAGAFGHGCASAAFPGGALLTASGHAGAGSVSDTLVLTASDIPGPALFIQANGLLQPINFGDGLLCAASGIIRLGVVFPSGSTASYPSPGALPIHTAGFVNDGDIKYYQCWYRTQPSLCGAGNHNLTQGLSITFGP